MMDFIRLLVACLLLVTTVQSGRLAVQPPSRITIEGTTVPASARRFAADQPLISCLWLNKNVSSLNCELFSSTAQIAGRTQTTTTAYVSENAEPLEWRRDATGCCAEQRRYVRFENGQLEHGRFGTGYGESPLPIFEIGTVAWVSAGMSVPKGTVSPSAAVQFTRLDAFVPLRDVALYMRMPQQLSNDTLSVDPSAGFERTLEAVETGKVWEARIASRYVKFEGAMPKKSDQSDAQLLIWPQGQVKRVFYIYGKTLAFLEFRDRHWQLSYQAHLKLAPMWLCSPNISDAKPAGFWAAVGGIADETGRRPMISTPLSKHAACSFETSTDGAFGETQFFSTLQANGLDQPKLWLAISIFESKSNSFVQNEARVINPVTRRLTNQVIPQTYGFMMEQRLSGR